jgi:phospholipid transport system substrate-binding protein
MTECKDPNVCVIFHRLISCFIFLSVFFGTAYGEAEQQRPSEVIKKFNAALLESMKKGTELGYSGRYKLLEPVIKDSFALPFMVSVSAGKYWKTLTEKDRNLLLQKYTEWSSATYAGRFKDYAGQKFEMISESKPVQGTVTVLSKLIDSDGEETDFYYKLRKLEGGWRIVDIQIEGISQLAVTRSQFVSVINKKGFDGLISMLKEKIEKFSKEKS